MKGSDRIGLTSAEGVEWIGSYHQPVHLSGQVYQWGYISQRIETVTAEHSNSSSSGEIPPLHCAGYWLVCDGLDAIGYIV